MDSSGVYFIISKLAIPSGTKVISSMSTLGSDFTDEIILLEPLRPSFENTSEILVKEFSMIRNVPSAAPVAAKATCSVADPANRRESAICSIASPSRRTLVPATFRLFFVFMSDFADDDDTISRSELFSSLPLFSIASPKLPTAHPDNLTTPPANLAVPPAVAAAVSPANLTPEAKRPNADEATRNDSARRSAPSRSASVSEMIEVSLRILALPIVLYCRIRLGLLASSIFELPIRLSCQTTSTRLGAACSVGGSRCLQPSVELQLFSCSLTIDLGSTRKSSFSVPIMLSCA